MLDVHSVTLFTRYDTMLYGMESLTCTERLTDSELNLAHGNKKKQKTKEKKLKPPISSEDTVQMIVPECCSEEGREPIVGRICETDGF